MNMEFLIFRVFSPILLVFLANSHLAINPKSPAHTIIPISLRNAEWILVLFASPVKIGILRDTADFVFRCLPPSSHSFHCAVLFLPTCSYRISAKGRGCMTAQGQLCMLGVETNYRMYCTFSRPKFLMEITFKCEQICIPNQRGIQNLRHPNQET